MARAGRWVREEIHGQAPQEPTSQEPGTQHFFLDDDCVPELGGSRPDRLADVRPQERVPRRNRGADRRHCAGRPSPPHL